MKKILRLLAIVCGCILAVQVAAQGIVVQKTDGTKTILPVTRVNGIAFDEGDYLDILLRDESKIQIPYSNTKKIVTFNYQEVIEIVVTTGSWEYDSRFGFYYFHGSVEGVYSGVKAGILIGKQSNLNKDNAMSYVPHDVSGGEFTDSRYESEFDNGTTYYYRAYAVYQEQYYYGEIKSFTVEGTVVSINVTTGSATNVTDNGATLNGSVSASNTTKSYTAGFFLSTSNSTPSSSSYTEKIAYSGADPVGNFSVSATGLASETKYFYRAFVLYNGEYYYGIANNFTTAKSSSTTNNSCPDGNHPHMIDLGLPSGTKWACCNVGANKPEDYGGYYAWGETNTKSEYTWETYKYGYYTYNMDFSHLVSIGVNIAGTSYDAATANWGSSWRMPTITQLKELFEKCSLEWTSQNGINGHKITGPNGITLFLPATGEKGTNGLKNRGTHGNYWSSSLYESTYLHVAYELCLFPDNQERDWYDYFDDRFMGLTIRPVRVSN